MKCAGSSGDPVLERLEKKQSGNARLVTFNINGFRTVFHYHPWNKLRDLSSMFGALDADIVTLQELKVARADVGHGVGKVAGFHSFITVPAHKKGYSGVGVYVRIPLESEPLSVRSSLKVVKAEEGITGCLVSHETGRKYRDSGDSGIGGYPNYEDAVCQAIDGEGRAIVLETAANVVIISVYCPANSMDTEVGEQFRIQFIEALLDRVRNLESLGKEVVLMGDINISRDLIDSAVGLEAMQKSGRLKTVDDERDFETVNRACALAYIRSSIPKMLLNEILIDSIDQEGSSSNSSSSTAKPRILSDTVRQIQGRKKGLYTVWNTIRNSRPGNFGSRIDLILVTRKLATNCVNANIWPFLMGSDHCPVFSDLDTCGFEADIPDVGCPKFEAKHVYKLSTNNIHSMFAMAKKRTSPTPAVDSTAPVVKRPRIEAKPSVKSSPVTLKAQNSISSFFKPREPSKPTTGDDSEMIAEPENARSPTSAKQQTKDSHNMLKITRGKFTIPSEKVPCCKHDEPCVLKTAKTSQNKGRKFWTCSKPAGSIVTTDDEQKYSCGVFKWK